MELARPQKQQPGIRSSESWTYRPSATPICFRLDKQAACRAFARAEAKTGKRRAARITIIAITTSSSIRLNADLPARCIDGLLPGDQRDLPCRSSPADLSPVVGFRGVGLFGV